VSPDTDKRMWTPKELQQQLGCGRTTIYELIATRQLPAVRIGRALRVAEEDLRAFVDRNRQ
jgi:excisionase family DNA binding protein